ncbi:Secretion-regulating guanine nucleotide exchange factor [Grifola frondosa]|uniref:Secretion-regulating guanine nucleotide exchange factor n=1 Tax=Grifola frondosa TaxID=5627 RepID=A0A1C7LV27_GRIFR|nr:Secretion-regulating guanine nucleotide exchange factor [Grifola frondosa]
MPPGCLLSAGSNARGQLGTGNLDDAYTFSSCVFDGFPAGTLPASTENVTHVSCGANHTLVLLDRRCGLELWGCGDGSKGQLGPSYIADVQASGGSMCVFRQLDLQLHKEGLQNYVVRHVAAGWETSYVILSRPGSSDVLISMGADNFGALGSVMRHAEGSSVLRPFHVVNLGSALGLSANATHTVAIQFLVPGPHHVLVQIEVALQDGPKEQYLVGWGTSRHGQLGEVVSTSGRPLSFSPLPRTITLRDGGPELGHVTSASLGNQHTVLLHSSGRLSTLGSDRKAQLRGLETLKDVAAIGCTWNGTYAVVRTAGQDRVMATGSSTHGQLGRQLRAENDTHHAPLAAVEFPPSLTTWRVVKMACGSEHVLCLLASSDSAEAEVWGWGWNEHGNLGIGHTENGEVPVMIWQTCPEDGGRAADVWSGCGTSWIFVKR